VTRAAATVTDRATRAHLDDAKDQIARMLDPKFVAPAPAATGMPVMTRGLDELACWPDYGIYSKEQEQ
jgi:hypothetical protein